MNRSLLIAIIFMSITCLLYYSIITKIGSITIYQRRNYVRTSSAVERFDENDALDEYHIPNQQIHDMAMKLNVSRENRYHKKIRLIAAFMQKDYIAVTMTSANLFAETVYCHYYDDDGIEFGQRFETKVFPESTIYCARKRKTKRIGITKNENDVPEIKIPVVDRTSVYTHFLSACIAPMYGDEPKWLHIVEFIEHYKIHGFTWFYVYVVDIDEYSRKILEDYERRKEIEVINLYDGFKRNNRFWHMPQIHDCLQRSRTHSKWTAFVDLDERLMMEKETIRAYLNTLNNDSISVVDFRQRWILKDTFLPEKYEDDEQLVSWMPTQKYTNSSSFGPPGHTIKCIVKSETVVSMFVHYPYQMYPGFKRIHIDPRVGYVRHYRDVNLGDWGKKWLAGITKFGNFSTTYYPKKYKNRLIENVKQRVHYVFASFVFKCLEIPEVKERILNELRRLAPKQRELIKETFPKIFESSRRNGQILFANYFAEHPHYKNIFPNFRGLQDSALLASNELANHASVYMCGLKEIVEVMDDEEKLTYFIARIARSHLKWNITKSHITNMIPGLEIVLKSCFGEAANEELITAYTALYDVIGNLLDIQKKLQARRPTC
ncbi:unnamed protein product [Caenorhabditis bovis]|uniref:Glycosyltransferase family 92 protein n=1 Tax=Caenorhabditis bovis TaxID=2654633 RepID=A0A8S1F5F8_9PELO|nr:unnamed protein product [Caenorhabditis bovis]